MSEMPGPKKDVLQPVDDAARRLAGTLLRTEREAALATLEPETGWPLASRVSLATLIDGSPIFLISQLSAHFAALEADPRASLLLGTAGRGDPLAHARMTVIGRAVRTASTERQKLRRRFLARHPKAELYADFGDFAFWRFEVERASLNGGFGKAFELKATDLVQSLDAAFDDMEPGAVEHMNGDHGDAVRLYATALLGREEGDWRLASLDPQGLDLILGDELARLWFEPALKSPDELGPRLVELAKRARAVG